MQGDKYFHGNGVGGHGPRKYQNLQGNGTGWSEETFFAKTKRIEEEIVRNPLKTASLLRVKTH